MLLAGSKHPVLGVAADGLVITAAVFGVTLGLVGLLIQLGPLGFLNVDQVGVGAIAVQLVGMIFSFAALLGGPLLALWLNGRPAKPLTFAALIAGLVAGGAVGVAFAVGAPGLAWVVTALFGGGEFAGPITVLVIVSVAFAAIVVWETIRAVGDARRDGTANRGLDAIRIACAVVIALVATIAVGLQIRAGGGEVGEIAIFMMLAGAIGGAVAGGAEWFLEFLERDHGSQAASAG